MNTVIQPTLKMSIQDFEYFRSRIFDLAGISLSDAKIDLVQGRLRSRITKLGMLSFAEYKDHMKTLSLADPEWSSFVNLLTTNKTDWFREDQHFNYLVQEFLPKWKTLGKKNLNVWCAASSTGEEPYTLSLVLDEALKNTGMTFSILATDIDTNVLSVARNGVYLKEKVMEIPSQYHSGFSRGTGEISGWMKVKNKIKNNVDYRVFNLSVKPYKMDQKFDLIFCRNVLIYFNPETIHTVVSELFNCTEKDAVLVIAHSESLQNVKNPWKYLRPSLYSKGKIF